MQQRVPVERRAEMNEDLVQREIEPFDARTERVIDTVRRLSEQLQHFHRFKLTPGAQHFEQRKSFGPLKRDETGPLDGLEFKNPQQIRMLHGRHFLHLALDLSDGYWIRSQLAVQDKQAHRLAVLDPF